MPQTDWRNTQEYKEYTSGPREVRVLVENSVSHTVCNILLIHFFQPKHQGSCHWAPMEQRTASDIAAMEQTRTEYEAWLKHKGITLRNAEDNYGNPNQEG